MIQVFQKFAKTFYFRQAFRQKKNRFEDTVIHFNFGADLISVILVQAFFT